MGPKCPVCLYVESNVWYYVYMNEEYNLTSRDYADLLGISTDTLRKRRRRNLEKNFIQDEQGKYWWKRDRPSQDKSPAHVRSKNGLFRVPGSKKLDTKPRNRGALERGEKSDYPNWRFEEANKIKALAKIRDKLGDEIVDEISPELFKLAKENVNKRKQKQLDKLVNNQTSHESFPIGVDRTPLKYGTMLNQDGLRNKDYERSRREYQKWNNETKVKFIDRPGEKVPDFYEPQPTNFRGPYEIGSNNEDIEIKGVYEGVDYSTERTFKNKIEESIYRLKNKK